MSAQGVLAEVVPDMTRFAHDRATGLLERVRPAWPPIRPAQGQGETQGSQPVYRGCPPARPPCPPAAPRLAKEHATGAWPAGSARTKAQAAVAATQLRVYHALLSSPGTHYQDLGADFYGNRAQHRRKARYHLTELDPLGYDVILTPGPGPDAGDATAGAQATAA
jgi:hypothetical protein